MRERIRTPQGCQTRRAGLCWHPCRGARAARPATGGIAGAQPPATFFHPSGMRRPALRQRLFHRKQRGTALKISICYCSMTCNSECASKVAVEPLQKPLFEKMFGSGASETASGKFYAVLERRKLARGTAFGFAKRRIFAGMRSSGGTFFLRKPVDETTESPRTQRGFLSPTRSAFC